MAISDMMKLMEMKSAAENRQRLGPSQALATGLLQGGQARADKIKLGEARSYQEGQVVDERKFKMIQEKLKNYDAVNQDGTPLGAEEVNLMLKYVAEREELPPGIQFIPKDVDAQKALKMKWAKIVDELGPDGVIQKYPRSYRNIFKIVGMQPGLTIGENIESLDMPTGAPQPVQSDVPAFNTLEEAEAAALPRGTKMTVGGRPATSQ